jgi:hypothetical protein
MRHRISRCSAFLVVVICATMVAEAAADLSAKEARKLIARVAGVELPSDAVRVKEITSLGTSAIVVAQVETAFRLVRGDDNKWRVAEIRTGDNKWEDVDMIVRALNVEKVERARAELETIATALESYRRERGVYVKADNEAQLIDHLNPRYLTRVIRVDPWHKPYSYEGTSDRFTLRSRGVDGKENTQDDLVFSNR